MTPQQKFTQIIAAHDWTNGTGSLQDSYLAICKDVWNAAVEMAAECAQTTQQTKPQDGEWFFEVDKDSILKLKQK